MTNSLPLVTKDQETSLREIGFDWCILPPTVSLACMWMWHVKGVYVGPSFNTIMGEVKFGFSLYRNMELIMKAGHFDTPELAQSAGLDAALEYLKKQMG